MPATFPATRAEIPSQRPENNTPQTVGSSDDRDAPNFVLLDTSGPSIGALVLSFIYLSIFFIVIVVVGRHLSASRPADLHSGIVVPLGPIWLPASPPKVDPDKSPDPLPAPAKPGQDSRPAAPVQPPETAKADAVAELPKPELSVLPLSSKGAASRALKLMPVTPEVRHFQVAEARRPTPETLGSLPLPRLLEREAALAAGLAALPANQRLALPQVSIRVNSEWLQALPQTQERLYFSLTTPRADSTALAYSPSTQTFTLERPLRPLWQIRDGERVPELAALRAAAARRLAVSPELVGLYTWHPPILENALRMFVLARMEQMGVRLGPHDVVTVRLASGTGGFVMNLEPLRAGGS